MNTLQMQTQKIMECLQTNPDGLFQTEIEQMTKCHFELNLFRDLVQAGKIKVAGSRQTEQEVYVKDRFYQPCILVKIIKEPRYKMADGK